MAKKQASRKYTICAPDILSEKMEKAYYSLTNIDCNFSRLLQCLLDSIINITTFISKQKKNFRHYYWHIIIQDKKTGRWYSPCNIKKPIEGAEK